MRFLDAAPLWLDLLVRELYETAETPAMARGFLSQIRSLCSVERDLGPLQWLYVRRRILDESTGIWRSIVDLEGRKSDYAFSYQRLIFALRETMAEIPEAGDRLSLAYNELRMFAPDPDRGLLASGVPLSFFVTWSAGWWTARRRSELEMPRAAEAWADARAAARADLIEVIRAA